jgi:23S rRNA pseudouridine2605 synthase
MTTDGELARRLMHPSFEIERTYAVRVLGEMTDAIRKRLTTSVDLDDGPAKFVSMKSVDAPDVDEAEEGAANRWFEVSVRQGRNRVVRRLFEAVDMQVSRLIRIAYGPVALGRGIKAGSFREATPEESAALYEAVGMATAKPPRKPRTTNPTAGRSKAGKAQRGKPQRPDKTSPHKPPARGFDSRKGKPPHPSRKGR